MRSGKSQKQRVGLHAVGPSPWKRCGAATRREVEVVDEDERPVARLPVSRALREPNRTVEPRFIRAQQPLSQCPVPDSEY